VDFAEDPGKTQASSYVVRSRGVMKSSTLASFGTVLGSP
jgi:hypothetical protein